MRRETKSKWSACACKQMKRYEFNLVPEVFVSFLKRERPLEQTTTSNYNWTSRYPKQRLNQLEVVAYHVATTVVIKYIIPYVLLTT